MFLGGGGFNEGDSMTGCSFNVLGVLPRTTPVDNKSSEATGISPEGNFGDDLSAAVDGVSGTGDREVERAGWFGSSRRVPRRSVTFVATGVGGSMYKKGVPSVVGPAVLGVLPRLILNLEVSFLAFGGGRDEKPWPAV
jgi:hypothetical protein